MNILNRLKKLEEAFRARVNQCFCGFPKRVLFAIEDERTREIHCHEPMTRCGKCGTAPKVKVICYEDM